MPYVDPDNPSADTSTSEPDSGDWFSQNAPSLGGHGNFTPVTDGTITPISNVQYGYGQTSGFSGTDPTKAGVTQAMPNQRTGQPQDAPDFSTPDGQLAWVKQQLAGTKYANDDPNYWLTRINQTGGFTPDNVNYWGTNIKNEYWGSPSQVAGEAANNSALNPSPFTYQPFTDQFSNPGFQAPTGVDESNDPGFQTRLQLGQRALQSSAAAKGTLLSGQTLSDLNDYAQNFASNEFGNVYNRALQGYEANSQNAFQQYSQKYQQYLNNYNQSLQAYGTNQGANQQAFGDTLALSAQNFGQNQQNWQNQFNVVGQQLGAAQSLAGAGQNYANQAGSLYQQGGNAAAAGTIGAGNAYGGAFGNLANYGAQLPYLYSNPTQASPSSTPGYGYTGYYTPKQSPLEASF